MLAEKFQVLNGLVAMGTLVNGVNVMGELRATPRGLWFTVDPEHDPDTPYSMQTKLDHDTLQDPLVKAWNMPVAGRTFKILDTDSTPQPDNRFFARLIVISGNNINSLKTRILFSNRDPETGLLRFRSPKALVRKPGFMRHVLMSHDDLYAKACSWNAKRDGRPERIIKQPHSVEHTK